jgi:hypothetical protein
MNERDRIQPSPESSCGPTKILLQGLWVDGRLGDIRPPTVSWEPLETSPRQQDEPLRSGLRRDGGLDGSRVDAAILRHIEDCPSCQQEADELKQLGQSLQMGLDSLCGAISETMNQDIEGTLQRIRELSGHAGFLRRIRRPFRLVLWISFLAFSLLASVTLAVAVYQTLKDL